MAQRPMRLTVFAAISILFGLVWLIRIGQLHVYVAQKRMLVPDFVIGGLVPTYALGIAFLFAGVGLLGQRKWAPIMLLIVLLLVLGISILPR